MHGFQNTASDVVVPCVIVVDHGGEVPTPHYGLMEVQHAGIMLQCYGRWASIWTYEPKLCCLGNHHFLTCAGTEMHLKDTTANHT